MEYTVSFINLAKRSDRLSQVYQNLETNKFDRKKVNRFEAIEHEYGEIGCAKSHFLLLSKLLCESKTKYHLIFEDDFRFSKSPQFLAQFLSALESSNVKIDFINIYGEWPLAVNYNKIQSDGNDVNLFRILNAQTTACYIVPDYFLAKMANFFLETIDILQSFGPSLKNSKIRQFAARNFSIDQYWRKLMASNIFIGTDIEFGNTEMSKSDIHQNSKFIKNPDNQHKISDLKPSKN